MAKELKNIIPNATKFTDQQWQFFVNLISDASDTKGDILKSYHAAGYSKHDTSKYAASKLYNSDKFQKALTAYRDYQAKNALNRELTSLEYTRQQLQNIIEAAKGKQDISNWRGAVMDLAKLDGLLAERLIVGRDDSLQMDAAMRQAALDLANRALLPGCQDAAEEAIDAVIPQSEPDTIEAQFMDDQGDQDSSTEPIEPDDWFLSDGDNPAGDTQDIVGDDSSNGNN